MGSLANSCSDLGEHQKAQELMSVVLEERKQLFDLGEHLKAQELMSVVLKKQKQLLDEDYPDTLLTMANLASSYFLCSNVPIYVTTQLNHNNIFVL
ncbi:hypothetical protein B0H16DRAFT_1903338 [Mycena metata]|uniref:Kinesin light chain n=1 Tax=Mycena metata TaxID=1033252 RepID=A0AAD7GJX6_9AGAR|nr:hypothetical protein B0H16DRAFT_1903338 [Mycena metata]